MKQVNIFNKLGPLMFAFLLIVSSTATSWATNYYVATTGNDANAGTLQAPFRSVQKSLNTVKAGDTCWISAGTYNEALILKTSGTNAAPITIKNYNGGTVTISSGNSRAVMLSGNINYYTIDGLNFTSNFVGPYAGDKDYSLDFGIGTSWWGWSDPTHGNNGFIIRNCNITGSIGFIGSYNVVENCVLNGAKVFTNGIHDMTASSHHNIYRNNVISNYTNRGVWSMTNTSNITVSGNIIHDFGMSTNGAGIDFDGAYMPVYNSIMDHNIIYNGNIGTQFENGINCIADGNIVHDCKASLTAINYGTEWADREYRTTNTGNIFRNNIAYNSSESGIIIISSPGTYIYNNSIHNTANYFAGIILANGGTTFNSNNCVIRNNIVTDSTKAITLEGSVTGTVMGNNLYHNSSGSTNTHYWNGYYTLERFQSTFGLDTNSRYANPLYVNSGAHDFNIQSSSPAVNVGATLANVLYDIEGTPRPQGTAYDVGAYEFHTTIEAKAPPSPPTGLTVQ